MKVGDGIRSANVDGCELQVLDLQNRDLIFSQVVGYSGIQWQKTG